MSYDRLYRRGVVQEAPWKPEYRTHWADEATLDMIKFLGRRIHQIRAMLTNSIQDHCGE